jgi:hypothetical protein
LLPVDPPGGPATAEAPRSPPPGFKTHQQPGNGARPPAIGWPGLSSRGDICLRAENRHRSQDSRSGA